tara:strand:- start:79 stop:189 length:111 start_codon:yes stop_codon:yes gene_type:complete
LDEINILAIPDDLEEFDSEDIWRLMIGKKTKLLLIY